MQARGANLLSLGVALPLIMASLPAAAGENDDVMEVVDDLCVNHRGNLKDGAAKAMKLPFRRHRTAARIVVRRRAARGWLPKNSAPAPS